MPRSKAERHAAKLSLKGFDKNNYFGLLRFTSCHGVFTIIASGNCKTLIEDAWAPLAHWGKLKTHYACAKAPGTHV